MKVHSFKIPKRPNENILLQIDQAKRFYDKLHQHQEIQLSYVHSGKGKLIVGNQITTFEMGDFVGIGSNLPHLFVSNEDGGISKMSSIFFTKESFGDAFFDNQEMQLLQPIWEVLHFGFKVTNKSTYFDAFFSKLTNDDKYSLFIKLLELLGYLTKVKKVRLMQKGHSVKISRDQGERLQQVFEFVMQNFQSEMKLKHVAERAHMTENAFCRFFKQRTNKTFFRFLTEIRIQHAKELLKEESKRTVLEIALLSGFPTISNFNRQFKLITRLSPSGYRNQFKTPI